MLAWPIEQRSPHAGHGQGPSEGSPSTPAGRLQRQSAGGAPGLSDVEHGDNQAGSAADAGLAQEHRGQRGAQAEAHRARAQLHVLRGERDRDAWAGSVGAGEVGGWLGRCTWWASSRLRFKPTCK